MVGVVRGKRGGENGKEKREGEKRWLGWAKE